MQAALRKYLRAFSRLKRGNTPYGIAPHKPVLVLSLMEMVEKGIVHSNRFYVNAELVGIFQENWRLLVSTLHHADFTQPFYYLQSDKAEGNPFWILQARLGCQIAAHIKSFGKLREIVEYGYLADDLYQLFTDASSREVLRQALLGFYFPGAKQQFNEAKLAGKGFVHDLEEYILNEPEARYRHIQIETEEDVFVRSGLFKKLVPKIYDSTCSFTGMRLESSYAHTFIDACHIVPFSVSHDDKVNNGIALCPNLHRAFDRGLVSIDGDYRIIISNHINEEEQHPYSLKQLEGRKARLPLGKRYHPAQENIYWHRENVFKG